MGKIGGEIDLKYEEDETGTTIINGKPYRTGFLKGDFFNFESQTEAEKYTRSWELRRESAIESKSPLYHYTTLAGFQGIIQSNGFWASDSRFLNDAEEIWHGAELTAKVLSYLTRRTTSPRFSEIIKRVRSKVMEPLTVGPLIACFSTVRDSLEQWRGYGSSGGICIGVGQAFRSSKGPPAARERAPMFYGPSMLPYRVLYRARKKIVLVISVVRRFETEYLKDCAAMPNYWPHDHDFNYVERIASKLQHKLVSFKNPAFEQESEVRVFIYHEQAEQFGGIKFRPSRLGLIPYICTGGRLSTPVTIENVMIGPSPFQTLVASSVRTFLDHHGYNEIPVELSAVPYRSNWAP